MMEQILNLIGTYAFPIVACVAMFMYMIKKDEKHAEQITALNASHKEEIDNLNNSHQNTILKLDNTIAENTKAIQQLIIVTTKLCERCD